MKTQPRRDNVKNPFTETYSDGTQMSYAKFGLACAVGTIGALGITAIRLKLEDRQMRKYMKKNHPTVTTLK